MNRKYRILVADAEPTVRTAIANYFSDLNFDCLSVENENEVINLVQKSEPDLIILSLELNGIDLLRHLKSAKPSTEVILTSSGSSVPDTVRAMKMGAYNVMVKPIHLDEMRDQTYKILEIVTTPPVKSRQERMDDKKNNLISRLMKSTEPSMVELFSVAKVVAASDSTIFISGESGTGKELMSSFIHLNSTRKNEGMVPVNCGAIPENLIESELFGHIKGAFTGAIAHRTGRLKAADGGTLFLDEVSELPLHMQVKLLRALQERRFEPVGASRSEESDFRIIAATNRDIEKEVEEGRFREDLYYRLNVIPLHIPPLRNHRGDILPLTEHFIERFNREKCLEIEGVEEEVRDRLRTYAWPGNIRELENVVERTVILKRFGTITVNDLPKKLKGEGNLVLTNQGFVDMPDDGIDLNMEVARLEERLIKLALDRTNGNKNQAARLLHLNRTTLVEKIKKRGLEA